MPGAAVGRAVSTPSCLMRQRRGCPPNCGHDDPHRGSTNSILLRLCISPVIFPSGRVQILPRQDAPYERRGLPDAIERDEASHARARALADQDLIERLEPGAKIGERMAL